MNGGEFTACIIPNAPVKKDNDNKVNIILTGEKM